MIILAKSNCGMSEEMLNLLDQESKPIYKLHAELAAMNKLNPNSVSEKRLLSALRVLEVEGQVELEFKQNCVSGVRCFHVKIARVIK